MAEKEYTTGSHYCVNTHRPTQKKLKDTAQNVRSVVRLSGGVTSHLFPPLHFFSSELSTGSAR